jgi:hypothetical protein
MTVGADGRVREASASGFDATLDSCVAGRARGWEFPVPKDHAGNATEASFAFTLQLQPE